MKIKQLFSTPPSLEVPTHGSVIFDAVVAAVGTTEMVIASVHSPCVLDTISLTPLTAVNGQATNNGLLSVQLYRGGAQLLGLGVVAAFGLTQAGVGLAAASSYDIYNRANAQGNNAWVGIVQAATTTGGTSIQVRPIGSYPAPYALLQPGANLVVDAGTVGAETVTVVSSSTSSGVITFTTTATTQNHAVGAVVLFPYPATWVATVGAAIAAGVSAIPYTALSPSTATVPASTITLDPYLATQETVTVALASAGVITTAFPTTQAHAMNAIITARQNGVPNLLAGDVLTLAYTQYGTGLALPSLHVCSRFALE